MVNFDNDRDSSLLNAQSPSTLCFVLHSFVDKSIDMHMPSCITVLPQSNFERLTKLSSPIVTFTILFRSNNNNNTVKLLTQ